MYSLINIGGLAMGMSVAIMIGLWVYDEVSYNHSYANYDHIAMLYRTNVDPVDQTTVSWFGTAQPVPKILTEKYGHLFKNVAIMWWEADYAIRVGEHNFSKKGQYIDKSAIDIFSMKMIRGDISSLDDPNAIIISKSAAEAIFGDEDPVGRTVRIDASHGRVGAIPPTVFTRWMLAVLAKTPLPDVDLAFSSNHGMADLFGPGSRPFTSPTTLLPSFDSHVGPP